MQFRTTHTHHIRPNIYIHMYVCRTNLRRIHVFYGELRFTTLVSSLVEITNFYCSEIRSVLYVTYVCVCVYHVNKKGKNCIGYVRIRLIENALVSHEVVVRGGGSRLSYRRNANASSAPNPPSDLPTRFYAAHAHSRNRSISINGQGSDTRLSLFHCFPYIILVRVCTFSPR